MTYTEKNEIIQRINTIEARILRLELLDQLNNSDWSKVPLNPPSTQGCYIKE